MKLTEKRNDWTTALKTLAAVGVEPPEEFAALQARLTAFSTLRTPQTDKLIDALVTGEGSVDELRADALAEAAGEVAINVKINDAVWPRLQGILIESGPDFYSAIQKRFNTAWTAFAKLADQANVDITDSEEVAHLDSKALIAWRDAKQYADELTRLVEALAIAAQIADRKAHPGWNDESPSALNRYGTDMLELGLIVDIEGVHIRRLWEAYSANGRCGCWSGLHRLGVTVRAKQLSDYAPVRRPRELVRRANPKGEGFSLIDPEDHGGVAPEPEFDTFKSPRGGVHYPVGERPAMTNVELAVANHKIRRGE
ncbi:hypothetical protein [Mycolicibacterium fortuitum]